MTSAQFVMIELKVTLSNTHRFISHSLKLTFDTLLPDSAQSETEVKRLIANGWV
jgi:phosphoglycolate phosphatase